MYMKLALILGPVLNVEYYRLHMPGLKPYCAGVSPTSIASLASTILYEKCSIYWMWWWHINSDSYWVLHRFFKTMVRNSVFYYSAALLPFSGAFQVTTPQIGETDESTVNKIRRGRLDVIDLPRVRWPLLVIWSLSELDSLLMYIQHHSSAY